MLTKQQAAKISQWANHQQSLMKYGYMIKKIEKGDLAKIVKLVGRKEDYVNSLIPSNCAIVLFPNGYVNFWIQVKGWYGAEKDYVCFSPDSQKKKEEFIEIASKYIEVSIKEDLSYFNY